MKATLKLELFGDDQRQIMRFWSSVIDGLGGASAGNIVLGYNPKSPGVRDCETGEFLSYKKDYTHANSKGSRGVYLYYTLESGRKYEVNKQISWRKWERCFLMVSDDGEIKECRSDR